MAAPVVDQVYLVLQLPAELGLPRRGVEQLLFKTSASGRPVTRRRRGKSQAALNCFHSASQCTHRDLQISHRLTNGVEVEGSYTRHRIDTREADWHW